MPNRSVPLPPTDAKAEFHAELPFLEGSRKQVIDSVVELNAVAAIRTDQVAPQPAPSPTANQIELRLDEVACGDQFQFPLFDSPFLTSNLGAT